MKFKLGIIQKFKNEIMPMYKRLSKRERLILYVTILIAVFFAGDTFVVRPIMRTFTNLNQRTLELNADIQKSTKLLNGFIFSLSYFF